MTKLTALGVDIFAGGFTLGISQHFEILGHLEEGSYGALSSKMNFPHLPIVVGQDNWKPFLDDLVARRGKPNLVYCNPPCAMFSIAGATMRGGGEAWRDDPRQSCWHACFSVFEYLKPDFFVIESVTRAYTAGREFIQGFVDRAAAMGYSTTHLLLDAQHLGLPQIRKRYFMVIHKKRLSIQQPNWGPVTTVDEALADVTDPGYFSPINDPVQKSMVPLLGPDTPMRPMWEKHMEETVGPPETWPRSTFGVIGRPRLFLRRINGKRPIGTIAGDYFIHPHEDRMLGVNELKKLGGFPLDYVFEQHPRYWPAYISRGVSPTVGAYLGAQISAALTHSPTEIDVSEETVDIRTSPEEQAEQEAKRAKKRPKKQRPEMTA